MQIGKGSKNETGKEKRYKKGFGFRTGKAHG